MHLDLFWRWTTWFCFAWKKIGWDLHSCLFNGLNECVCTTRLAGWLAQEE